MLTNLFQEALSPLFSYPSLWVLASLESHETLQLLSGKSSVFRVGAAGSAELLSILVYPLVGHWRQREEAGKLSRADGCGLCVGLGEGMQAPLTTLRPTLVLAPLWVSCCFF